MQLCGELRAAGVGGLWCGSGGGERRTTGPRTVAGSRRGGACLRRRRAGRGRLRGGRAPSPTTTPTASTTFADNCPLTSNVGQGDADNDTAGAGRGRRQAPGSAQHAGPLRRQPGPGLQRDAVPDRAAGAERHAPGQGRRRVRRGRRQRRRQGLRDGRQAAGRLPARRQPRPSATPTATGPGTRATAPRARRRPRRRRRSAPARRGRCASTPSRWASSCPSAARPRCQVAGELVLDRRSSRRIRLAKPLVLGTRLSLPRGAGDDVPVREGAPRRACAGWPAPSRRSGRCCGSPRKAPPVVERRVALRRR